MELYQRIKARREELGMSQNELAKRLGYKDRSTIAKIEAGVNDITQTKIEAFAKALNTTASDLMGWEESQLASPDISSDIVTFQIEAGVAAHYDAMPDVDNIAPEQIDVPRAYLDGRSPADYCAMRVKGQSMFPDYHDGDVVLVLKTQTLDRPGQIGVIRYGEGAMTIKRIDYVTGEDWLELIPINPACAPERISGADLEQCEVVGVPKLLLREFGE